MTFHRQSVPAIIDSYDRATGFWLVRHGQGVADVEHLHTWQFAPNTEITAGARVELRYIVARNSGLWYAYPAIEKDATPPPT